MSFTSGNISYNLNSEVAWEIGFDEIPGKLWNEYSTEEKNIKLGQFSLEEYDIWWLGGSSPDNSFFELNESGEFYWYFEDPGYDFDYESPNDTDSNNIYEITFSGGFFNEWDDYEVSVQQNLNLTINDIADSAASISVSNGELEEDPTDENDYFRQMEHNVSYDWKDNTKLISNYSADQTVNWTFDTKSDEKYFQISSSGVLKYKALPEFFTASANNLDAISQVTLKATNEQGLISQINVGIQPDNFCPIKYNGNNSSENFSGKKGGDFLNGRGGNDKLKGNQGNDLLNGGSGNDKLIGGKGKDTAVFSSKSNVVKLFTTKKQNTKDGKDTLIGIENVNAGSGNDKVYGSKGSNILAGGKGNDLLVGGLGNDKLIGGKGKDIFKLSKGKGYDLIQDFKNKQDKIFIGSTKKLKLKNKGKDVFIYSGKDLLAKVKKAKGDLSKKGKYLV